MIINMYTHAYQDDKMYYPTIKENLVHNFFKKYYLNSAISNKELVFSDMQMRSSFKIIPMDDTLSGIVVFLDDCINISIYFNWDYNEKTNIYVLRNIN